MPVTLINFTKSSTHQLVFFTFFNFTNGTKWRKASLIVTEKMIVKSPFFEIKKALELSKPKLSNSFLSFIHSFNVINYYKSFKKSLTSHFHLKIFKSISRNSSKNSRNSNCIFIINYFFTSRYPFQSSVVFHIENTHLICTANRLSGIYIKCNTELTRNQMASTLN